LRGKTRPPREPWKKRLLVSALQSEAFNRVLALRIERGVATRALDGDVLRRADSGGLFVCEDAAGDDERAAAGLVAPTGPMPGPKMMTPRPGSPAAEIEREGLANADLTDADMAAAGALAEGTRRALVIRLDDPLLHPEGPSCEPVSAVSPVSHLSGDAIAVTFALPKGSYATALLREIQKAATQVL
jgi:tRNA pseudouridine13 synthase